MLLVSGWEENLYSQIKESPLKLSELLVSAMILKSY